MKIRFHVWTVSQDRRTSDQVEQYERLEEKRRAAAAALGARALAVEPLPDDVVVSILTRRQDG